MRWNFKGSNPKSKAQIPNICSNSNMGLFPMSHELLRLSGADLVTPSGEVANFNPVNYFTVLFTSQTLLFPFVYSEFLFINNAASLYKLSE